MFAKFFYAYITLGVIFFALGIYRAIHDGGLSITAITHFIPGLLVFYLAYKAYKIKKDQELM